MKFLSHKCVSKRIFFCSNTFLNESNRIEFERDESRWFIHILIHFFSSFLYIKKDIDIDVKIAFAIFSEITLGWIASVWFSAPYFPCDFTVFQINCELNWVLYVEIKSMQLSVVIWHESEFPGGKAFSLNSKLINIHWTKKNWSAVCVSNLWRFVWKTAYFFPSEGLYYLKHTRIYLAPKSFVIRKMRANGWRKINLDVTLCLHMCLYHKFHWVRGGFSMRKFIYVNHK